MSAGRPALAQRADYSTRDSTALTDLRTLRDFLRYAVSRFEQAKLFFGHGSDNAWDEAVHLMLYTLHLAPDTLEPYLDATLTQSERQALLSVIELRIDSRRPAPYLTGIAWLQGLSFQCDERALVPRSLLVEAMHDALPEWLDVVQPSARSEWPRTILDLCCGGASIAIHAAHKFEHAQLTAADISAPALELARENIASYQLQSRISTVQSDLTDALRGPFDLIFCNPPYVPDVSMSQLPAEYRHEPEQALRAGPDGMDIIRRVIEQAGSLLNEDGVLVIELGHEAAAFEAAMPGLEFSWLPVSAGTDMIVAMTRAQLLSASP